MSVSRWISRYTDSLVGKTVAISGATGGIGRELCRHLVLLGASLILLDRNLQRSQRLAAELKTLAPTLSITHIQVDMEDMSGVRAAADRLLSLPVDALILNAGAYSIPRHRCDTGYDNVFQINFVSPYYLARRLLPHLKSRGGRVIAVGSIAHTYSVTDPEDIDFSTRRKASLVYGNAKRYLMLSLLGLAGQGESVVVTHPGITFTNITAHYPKLIFAVIKHPMKVIFMSPRKASLCILRGLFETCGADEWIGPRLWNIWGFPRKRTLRTYQPSETDRICVTAEEIYRKITEKPIEK